VQYLIANLGLSLNFGNIDFVNTVFPTKMLIDYIRVYQHPSRINIGCDPPGYPTSNYINTYVVLLVFILLYNDRIIDRFIEAYTNPNLTTWVVRLSPPRARMQTDDAQKQTQDDYKQSLPRKTLTDNCS
jgi:beta-glucan synthesis-associated protein KRE6